MQQVWQRDSSAAALELGAPGAFDDQHLFAPCVARMDDRWWMWYSGSRGSVDQRRFSLGLAQSGDGCHFERVSSEPLLQFNGNRSIVTVSVLRHPDGTLCRENGRLRFWFASCDFPSGDGKHQLHHSSSVDGMDFDQPSAALLEDAYAPCVIFDKGVYRMWFIDTSSCQWWIAAATSSDGLDWQRDPEPVLELDQPWEDLRLNYPWVITYRDVYLLYYSSRLAAARPQAQTGIGCALSYDGVHFEKISDQPLLVPDPRRSWETHYCSTPCVLPDPAGGLRMWYSTRPRPELAHKYFSISTAVYRDACDNKSVE